MTERNGNILSRDEILGADDLVYELVPVPEWGKDKVVRVRSLSGTDRDAFESSLLVGSGKSQRIMTLNIRAKLCSLVMVDEAGNPLFNLNDVDALGRKSVAALDRVFEVAQRLSRITDKDVEEMAKNSEIDLSDASS
jgi:hypothetical protein